MPLKKISEEPKFCRDPEHNPPSMISLSPGSYEYECPRCGKKQIFRVSGGML